MKESQKLFTCQRCGYCCHGQTTVSLNDDDITKMSIALNLSREDTLACYLRKNKNEIQMNITNDHCVFYDDGCKVHSGRPHRCAQWPLHPSILLDKSNFSAIKTSCPGINSDLSYEEFAAELKKILE